MVDDYGRALLDHVTMSVHAGEIVGVAGIQGNGQTELVEAITGLLPIASGEVEFLGRNVTRYSPRKRHEAGMAHVPEDRNEMGMISTFTISENLVLDAYYAAPYSKRGVLDSDAIRDSARVQVKDYDVRPPNIDNTGGALSGGNAQKMIVAREFSRDVPMVICASADSRHRRRLNRVHPRADRPQAR